SSSREVSTELTVTLRSAEALPRLRGIPTRMHRPPQRHGDPMERRLTAPRGLVNHHRHRIRPNLPARNPRPALGLVIAALRSALDERRHRLPRSLHPVYDKWGRIWLTEGCRT